MVDWLLVASGILIIAAVLFGGASRENPLRLAAVELISLPTLVLAVRRLVKGTGPTPVGRLAFPLVLLALAVALPLLQLVPLPPAIWTALPGHGPWLEASRLLREPIGWAPLSLWPSRTFDTFLALLPPTAMFLAVLALGATPAQRLVPLWIVLASLGLLLGVAQIAEPTGGWAWPYRTTNLGSLVGFFANRNHEAAFLLALGPFAAALALPRGRGTRGRRSARFSAAPWLAGLFLAISVVALGVIRSRTGVLLTAPAMLFALLLLARGDHTSTAWRRAGLLAAPVALAALAVAIFGLSPILDRFVDPPIADLRYKAWPYVAAAAWAHMPFGSGLGSFDRIFMAVEPLVLVGPAFFNHAHNDYLELWLETGLFGPALMLAFVIWFGLTAVQAWRGGTATARAASLSIVLLLAASSTDYPLRTESLAVLLAFACGHLAAWPISSPMSRPTGRKGTAPD